MTCAHSADCTNPPIKDCKYCYKHASLYGHCRICGDNASNDLCDRCLDEIDDGSRVSLSDSLYWLTSPRGIDICLECSEEVCWYDRPDRRLTDDCPLILQVSIQSRRRVVVDSALDEIEILLSDGPKSSQELISALVTQGFSKNIVYNLISKDLLDYTRPKMHPGSKGSAKIVVIGTKRTE